MLVTMMLPTQVIMIPQYLIYYRLGLVPGYVPLILPYFCGQAFFIYQMMQFMQGIPKDLDEAATIDGANRFQRIMHVTLPNMRMIIVLMMVLSLGNVLNAGFDQVYNMYSEAVYSTGDILDTFIYRLSFKNGLWGQSAAVSMFKSVVSTLFISVSYLCAYKFADYRVF